MLELLKLKYTIMKNSIGESKVILCPLYGDIKIDWHKNEILNKSMLNWPFFEPTSTGEKADKMNHEKPYQTCLSALLEINGFNFYVGLEVNVLEKHYIFWNNQFQIDVYLEKQKILNLAMTGFANHRFGVWSHFDCIPEQLEAQKWNKKDWKNYFYTQINKSALALIKESKSYSNKAIEVSECAENIFKTLYFK